MTIWAPMFFGGFVVSYIVFRLIMVAFRKNKHNPLYMLVAGGILLIFETLVGGYGMQDSAPSPQFFLAFTTYLGPVLLVLVIELVRTGPQRRQP